jgi:uncharacterized protein YyaL (SSP411 family)
LGRRGMLTRYLAPGTPPGDLAALRHAVREWVARALAPRSETDQLTGACGASAGYHVVEGWAPPYPEVTGYLIPTLLRELEPDRAAGASLVAVRAGVWLVDTRLPEGGICRKQWSFDATTPSVFNTAQVIDGWCALADRTADARWIERASESADWILSEQEPDGSWVRSAFNGVPHSYYARAASALAELSMRVAVPARDRYGDAARRAFDWVLEQQRADGWFDRAGFAVDESPTTHSVGYVLEGLLQGGVMLHEDRYISAAERAAAALRSLYERDGRLPGRLAPGWAPAARWRCVTGDAQVGLAWARLARYTGETAYREAAYRIADDVRYAVRLSTSWPDLSGGVPGAMPRAVGYDPFSYPTHAAKFTLDLVAELEG